MKRIFVMLATLLVAALTLVGCVSAPTSEAGWTTVFDGTHLNNFTRLGDANWRLVDGLVQADLGGKDASYLVSKQSYDDFQMRAEFWVDSDANSGKEVPPEISPSPEFPANEVEIELHRRLCGARPPHHRGYRGSKEKSKDHRDTAIAGPSQEPAREEESPREQSDHCNRLPNQIRQYDPKAQPVEQSRNQKPWVDEAMRAGR